MLKSFLFIIVFVPACLFISGCNSTQEKTETKPFDLTQAKKEIEAANKEFIDLFAKADSVAVANFFTEDAKSMGPNEPAIEGRGKIQSVYGGLIIAGFNHMTLTTTGVWGNEEMLGEEGLYTFANSTGKELDKGKYIVLWKKQDGKWKLFRDCYNSDLPVQASK